VIGAVSVDDGMAIAGAFFALTLLMAFAMGLLFGFVRFMKRLLG